MSLVARRFEPVAQSVGAARRYAVSVLPLGGIERLQDDVRTVVSELATNAVLHARTAFTVSITVDGSRVRVAVTDGSPSQPRVRRPGSGDATTGRGLRMVAELSTAWGVEPDGGGKTTWCELTLTSYLDRKRDERDIEQAVARPVDVETRYGESEWHNRAAMVEAA